MTGAVWFTGLPGAGKSTIVRAVADELADRDVPCEVLSMDDVRDLLTPDPAYTEEEREQAYRGLVGIAERLARHCVVLVDATAHRRAWRDALRGRVDRFVEVHVDCPLEVAMEREAAREDHPAVADLYERALERHRGEADHPDLGDVIGLDVPYEAPEDPEVRIRSDETPPERAASEVLKAMASSALLGSGESF